MPHPRDGSSKKRPGDSPFDLELASRLVTGCGGLEVTGPTYQMSAVLAMIVMIISAGTISDFVNRRPTIKMLALSFLLLIGVMLVADGFGHHIPKGYIYFAMAFSVGVELLNMKVRAKSEPVQLHQAYK